MITTEADARLGAAPREVESTGQGFARLMCAQFLSALADNAVLIVAIARLADTGSPAWMTPLLKFAFIASFVLFAFIVGALADRWPKPRVMFATNAVKAVGCALMLFGVHPLAAYALIGFGAAAYSPAKYGMLLELAPARRLVAANAWLEGLTVGSVILGTLIGGALVSPEFARIIGAEELRRALAGATVAVLGLYCAAAIVNLFIPPSTRARRPMRPRTTTFLGDFAMAVKALVRDRQGCVSLTVTALLWGVGAVLQFVIIDWGREGLGLTLDRASMLQGVAAIGVAIGAIAAARTVSLERALAVLPFGMVLGPLVIALLPVRSLILAGGIIAATGLAAGFFIVPMNALLQHRGHLLTNAGQSIAVQNFCENLSVMAMLGAYAAVRAAGLPIAGAIVLFGAFTSIAMLAICVFARLRRS